MSAKRSDGVLILYAESKSEYKEEQFLVKAFGEEYSNYKNKVRRYLGRK